MLISHQASKYVSWAETQPKASDKTVTSILDMKTFILLDNKLLKKAIKLLNISHHAHMPIDLT